MSGVEITGIVLGALPLIISAIEDYDDGIRKMRKMKHLVRELKLLNTTLGVERSLLLQSIELLLGTDVDSRTMSMLLNDIGGPLWSEAFVEELLQTRLQRDYQLFIDAVGSMNQAVSDLRGKLNIGSRAKTGWRQTLSKLKASLSLYDYQLELECISKSNKQIERLVNLTNKLQPVRKSRDALPNSEATRLRAISIYASIRAAFHQHCGQSHKASLSLNIPLPTPTTMIAGQRNEPEIRQKLLLLHQPQDVTPDKSQWDVEATEIRLIHERLNSAEKVPKFRQTITIKGNPAWMPIYYQRQIEKIHDLCESLGKITHRVDGHCFGYLSDQAMLYHWGLWWPLDSTRSNLTRSRCLSELIKPSNQVATLSDISKRRLALSLAQGMLHLFETPWLSGQWGREDILVAGELSLGTNVVPFITAVAEKASKNRTYFQSCSLIKNETVFALGVLLIEICLGPFEELSGSSKSATNTSFQDYITADAVLSDVDRKMGIRYGNAVRRCIICDFGLRETVLEEPLFRKAVYDGVVAELQKDVDKLI